MVENREIFIPHLYSAPAGGNPVGISWRMKMFGFDADKTRMTGLPCGEKTDNMLSRFHLIPERHRQTDRQICYINIVRQYADAR